MNAEVSTACLIGATTVSVDTSVMAARDSHRARPVRVMLVEASQAPSADTPPSAGFSAVAGRILDQLNPTAWLPAALVVADLWIAVAYRLAEGEPIDRFREIASVLNGKPFGILVTTLLALVLMTIITQSIEFASIRVLEGYWGHGWLAARLTQLGVAVEARRFRNLISKGDRLEAQALRSVLPLLKHQFDDDPRLTTILATLIRDDGITLPTETSLKTATPAQLERLSKLIQNREWLKLAVPHLVRRVDAVDIESRAFPDYDRLLPTRLGQTLRSVEDRLVGVDSRYGLRGYVIRNLPHINPMLLREHDQFRNRLDMYAVMVFVGLALTVINPIILWPPTIHWMTLAVIMLTTIITSIIAYRGAISAAEDYGTVLTEIDRQLFATRGRT